MARVTDRDSGRELTETTEIQAFLADYGIWYRKFEGSERLDENATDDEILETFGKPIEDLKAEGDYVTADVINVNLDTPGLDDLLAKFEREHRHDEDEVRFIVGGRGLFHIHPDDGPVFSIEVVKGDMINVPKHTRHWFHLCEDRTIRAIRLFQDQSGWVPHYTESGMDAEYEPVCFGHSYIPTGS